MNFLYNLSIVLGHTILLESKSAVPQGVKDDFKCNMDSPSPPNPNIAINAQSRATVRNLPQILNILNAQAPKGAQALYDASQAVSPQYAGLDIAMKNAFGGATSDANAAIASRNTSNIADIFKGSGSDLVRSSTEAAKIADPEYYTNRALVASKTGDLLSGQDPNKLTGAELENATRGVNRTNISTGNVNPSQTSTISNAMTFGDALSKKRAEFGNALNLATGTLPAMKSGVDTFRQVTGQPGTSGLGGTQFAGVTPVSESQTAGNQASGLLGSATQNWTNLANNMDYRNTPDKFAAGQIQY